MQGKFIVIEGIDGSGKTTVTRILVEKLRARGLHAIYTSEPTSSPIGSLIRSEVIRRDVRVDPRVEVLLFAADRIWHLVNEVLPALRRGVWVVSDRYVYSSIAYQGALGVPIEWIRSVNRFAPPPDAAFYIDVPPDVGLRRKGQLESATFENVVYLAKVREIYLDLVRRGELIYVDGSRSVTEVVNAILDATVRLA